MIVILFFIAHWYLSLFTQTFFHHRYSAHKMFKMSKGWEKFWFILSFVFQGASYLSPRAYGILHRLHHANADTELDPHSPKYDKNLFAMMWRTKKTYNGILNGSLAVEPQYTKDVPDWPAIEKLGDNWAVRIMWGVLYGLFYIAFDASWWMYFTLLPIQFLMGPFHGAIINWFAHKYGYTNYKVDDTSKNLMPVDIFMLGEGFHNNHHKHSGRANFGSKWFELDPVYPFIYLFDKIGMIKLRKTNVRLAEVPVSKEPEMEFSKSREEVLP